MPEPWEQFVGGHVERLDALELDAFALQCLSKRPVLLVGGARNMPAVRLWDTGYLSQKVGEARVSAFTYQAGARNNERWSPRRRRRVRFSLSFRPEPSSAPPTCSTTEAASFPATRIGPT